MSLFSLPSLVGSGIESPHDNDDKDDDIDEDDDNENKDDNAHS